MTSGCARGCLGWTAGKNSSQKHLSILGMAAHESGGVTIQCRYDAEWDSLVMTLVIVEVSSHQNYSVIFMPCNSFYFDKLSHLPFRSMP